MGKKINSTDSGISNDHLFGWHLNIKNKNVRVGKNTGLGSKSNECCDFIPLWLETKAEILPFAIVENKTSLCARDIEQLLFWVSARPLSAKYVSRQPRTAFFAQRPSRDQ